MEYDYVHRRRVEFSDTDMAGIMHFSRFFVFMESAEHAFFRSLGFSVHTFVDGKRYGWPRIEANCVYRKPLKFEDEVEIRLRVADIGGRTIDYEMSFVKMNGDPAEEAASGRFKVICVTFDEAEGRMRSVTIPETVRGKLETAPKMLV